MYQRILVATDGSALSKKAGQSSIGLAEPLGADLTALGVVFRYRPSSFEGDISLTAQDVAFTKKRRSDLVRAVGAAPQTLAITAGVKKKMLLMHSDIVAEFIMAAEKKVRPHRHGVARTRRRQTHIDGKYDPALPDPQCLASACSTLTDRREHERISGCHHVPFAGVRRNLAVW